MAQVREKPLWGLLLGLGMTLVVQSSSATIGVLQGVARQAGPDGVHSLLGLAGAVPVLLGDNVGTTITAILAAAGGTRDAKRRAAAHCCFNLSGHWSACWPCRGSCGWWSCCRRREKSWKLSRGRSPTHTRCSMPSVP